ncbi:MAG: Ldh family oxidoreductase [Ruminococcaceae bacterium]|nr:Ldh family oxidoreductase [Oscillospiraceae bacterium]
MNNVHEDAIKVQAEQMKRFVSAVAQKSGMPEAKAEFLAHLLVENDLRGVFSHGTQQIAAYARLMRDRVINPDPHVYATAETPTTVIIDGDGGLGYFPAYQGAEAIIEKARTHGLAAAVTRNHGHIGAAGIYARLLVENDLIAYVTSGTQLNLSPEQSIMRAAGGSPMSFAVPSGQESPMILDFGTMHDLYASDPHVSELFDLAPGLVFRSMGLGFMCQALGGFLAGITLDKNDAARTFKGGYQGSLIIALDINRFLPLDDFKKQMDNYMKITSQMKPMPGYDKATLPGVLEATREKDWRISGIPVATSHMAILAKVADEFAVPFPF